MYNPTSPTKSSKDRKQRQRSVNFDLDNEQLDAPRSTASSRTSPDLELRARRAREEAQLDVTDDEMDERRPPFHRHHDGKSEEALLFTHSKEEVRATRRASASPNRRMSAGADSLDLDGRFGDGAHDRLRPTFSRSSTMRSQSPGRAEKAMKETKRTYMYAGFFLVLSLISFVIQTETAVYIQHELGWSKAYAML